MIRVLAFLLLLAACGGPLSLLTGGGPNVGVNAQVGAENRQSVVSVERGAPTASIRPRGDVRDVRQEQNEVRAETINNLYTGLPPIYWLAFALWSWVLLWLDKPSRWPGQIMALFKRNGR